MSEMIDKSKEVGEKAKALADAGMEKLKGVDWKAQGDRAKAFADDGIERLKKVNWKAQGDAAAEKAKAAKEKIQATWKSGTKGKIVCIAGALGVLWIGACVFGSGSSDVGEDCKIDYSSNLTVAAAKNSEPEENVGYISLGGFKVYQYLPNEGAALAMLCDNGMANLLAATSGNVGGVSEDDELGNIIYVKTPRLYTDGQALAGGVYIYKGITTYKTAHGSKSVKVFLEMDEKIAERRLKEDNDKKLKEEERNAKPIEGFTIPLPEDAVIKSICGLTFGKPPAEIEKVLGKRVEGRPISGSNDSAVFMLKKPFRLCDRVKVTYHGEPPFMVLSEVVFMGKVDKEKVSALSCRDEVEAVSKMLCEHYKMSYEEKMGGESEGEYYHYNHLPDGRLDCKYNIEAGLFTIEYRSQELTNGDWYYKMVQEIKQKVKEKGESKKKKLNMGDKEGSDVL